jgi:hypothetical protein
VFVVSEKYMGREEREERGEGKGVEGGVGRRTCHIIFYSSV